MGWIRNSGGSSIHKDSTPPVDTSLYWLDTSSKPNILKHYNGTDWVNIGANNKDEIIKDIAAPADTSLYWLDSSVSPATLKHYIDGAWKAVGADVVAQSTAPTDTNKKWLDTSTEKPVLKKHDGIGWVESKDSLLEERVDNLEANLPFRYFKQSIAPSTEEKIVLDSTKTTENTIQYGSTNRTQVTVYKFDKDVTLHELSYKRAVPTGYLLTGHIRIYNWDTATLIYSQTGNTSDGEYNYHKEVLTTPQTLTAGVNYAIGFYFPDNAYCGHASLASSPITYTSTDGVAINAYGLGGAGGDALSTGIGTSYENSFILGLYSSSIPPEAVVGDEWFDTSTNILKVCDGVSWKETTTTLESTKVTFSNVNFTSADVSSALDELFINVSNGKSKIATAITDKGVTTSSSDTFSTMATNISNISGGGQALDTPSGLKLSFDFVSGTAEASWEPLIYNTGLAGYNIYKNGTKVNASVVTETSYTITGLVIGEVADVYVTSVSTDGVESARTRTVPIPTAKVFDIPSTLTENVTTNTQTPISSDPSGTLPTEAELIKLNEGSWNVTLT